MKRNQSIAFTGLLCAVHILIIFMTETVPFFDLALIFFAPIFSAILAVKCEFKYSFILFVATMLIGCIINPVTAVLSLMTPLIYGISYGLLIKHNVKSTTIVYLLTITVMLLLLLDIKIITSILKEDFLKILCEFFHIDSFYHSKEALFVLIAFAFSQAFVTHITLKYVLKKMKFKVKKNEFPPFFLVLLFIAALCCAVFIKKPVDYKHLSYILAVIFALPYVLYAFQKNKAIVPLLITSSILFLIVVIPLLSVVKESYRYLLFTVIAIPEFCYGIFRQFSEHTILEAITTI